MTDGENLLNGETEGDEGAWTRLRGWPREHRGFLALVGLGVAAVALGALGRGSDGPRTVTSSAPALADAAREAAAQASSRVAKEFESLSRAYKMSAMDQTVGQAVRRHQRWTPEELAVLGDSTKTALDKAFELGRTFNGVMAKSIEQGLSSKVP